MIPFAAGYALVFGVLSTVAIISARADPGPLFFWTDPIDWRDIIVKLFLLPTITAWVALDALHRARPRRWLDARVKAGVRLLVFGLGAGVLAAAGLSVLLAWVEEHIPAWLLVPSCVALATGLAFVLMPRKRAGRCVHCGYDLSDGGLDGRCTECGSLDPL